MHWLTESTIDIETEQFSRNGTDWLRFCIADTGQGIEPEDFDHIFQYFYRGEKSRNRKSGGSGMALARQFVLSHGGTIRAKSHPGKGTQFIVDLPYASP